MSDDNTTHFQFSLAGIELEISGDRHFVERMYRTVMHDIEMARKGETPKGQPSNAQDERRQQLERKKREIVWVHRCSEMMHKIYMSSPKEIGRSPLLRSFDASQLGVVYAEKALVGMILPKTERGQTLWAELTEAGRERIKQASE